MSAAAAPSNPLIEDAAPEPAPAPGWRRFQGWLRDLCVGRTEDELLVASTPGAENPSGLILFFIAALALMAVMANWQIEGDVLRWLLPIAAFAAVFEVGTQRLELRFGARLSISLVKVATYAGTTGLAMVAVCSAAELDAYSKHPLVFLIYLLLVHTSAVRDEPRVPLAAGVASLVSFGVVASLVPELAAAGGPEKLEVLLRDFDRVSTVGHGIVIACATAGAVEFSRRGQAIRRLSLRDGLTGLANRQVFDACLQVEAQRARRTGLPLSIAMIDVDHFKSLNDTFGHAYGDEVLRWIAEVLRDSFRASDIVARYGGEEFVVIFVDSADDRLVSRLEMVRERIASAVLRGDEDAAPVGVSVSMGMARWPEDGADVTEVLRRADACLYLAKRGGRNRVVTSWELPEGSAAPPA
jgi:diguanylate cyclase (GGDEF)-like protein